MFPSFVTEPPLSIYNHLLRARFNAEERRLGMERGPEGGPSAFRLVSPGVVSFQADAASAPLLVGERKVFAALSRIKDGVGPDAVAEAILHPPVRDTLRPYAPNHPVMLQPGDTVLIHGRRREVASIRTDGDILPQAAVAWADALSGPSTWLHMAGGGSVKLHEVTSMRPVITNEYRMLVTLLRPVRVDAVRRWQDARWLMGPSFGLPMGAPPVPEKSRAGAVRAASQSLSALDAMLINAASHRSGAPAGGPEGAFGDRYRALRVRDRQLGLELRGQSSMMAPDGFRDSTELWKMLREERDEVRECIRLMEARRPDMHAVMPMAHSP